MECQLSGEQIRGLCRAVQCLAKVAHSDYITFLAAPVEVRRERLPWRYDVNDSTTPVELSLQGINTAKTAYLVVNFATDYFQTFNLSQPTCSCSALVKSVLAVFRTAPAAMRTLTITADGKEPDNIRWIIDCQNGMRKIYTIACVNDREVLSASIDPSTYPSSLVARPKALLRTPTNQGDFSDWLKAFLPPAPLRDALLPVQALHIQCSSADGRLEASPEAAMHTQLWVDPGEHFEAYCHRGDAVDVTFSVKEVKCVGGWIQGSTLRRSAMPGMQWTLLSVCTSGVERFDVYSHPHGQSPALLLHTHTPPTPPSPPPTLPPPHPPLPPHSSSFFDGPFPRHQAFVQFCESAAADVVMLFHRAGAEDPGGGGLGEGEEEGADEMRGEEGAENVPLKDPGAGARLEAGWAHGKRWSDLSGAKGTAHRPGADSAGPGGGEGSGRGRRGSSTWPREQQQPLPGHAQQDQRQQQHDQYQQKLAANQVPDSEDATEELPIGRLAAASRGGSGGGGGGGGGGVAGGCNTGGSVDGNGMVTGGAADVSAARFMPTEASTPGRLAAPHQRIGDEDEYVDATPPERRMYDDEDETMD
ncbi:unnamed protein product [Closterium sp. Naga37s-1]|nr:unnamed protein product [Closterium sp. Naga37s-1]